MVFSVLFCSYLINGNSTGSKEKSCRSGSTDGEIGKTMSEDIKQRYSEYSTLKFDRPTDRVLRITLDRPESLNSVSAEMHRDLVRVWSSVSDDPDTNAVIVTGAGSAFSAGGDFSLVEENAATFENRARVFHEARDLVYNIINCKKPTISAIRGPAVGAGLAVALLCDISIASRTARIIDGHTRLGVAAGDHAATEFSGEQLSKTGRPRETTGDHGRPRETMETII